MKQTIRLCAFGMAMVLSAVSNTVPAMAIGQETEHLIIAEVSPESKKSASEEYIELFNPNSTEIDATRWQLQYRSYSHATNDTGSWTTKAILGCASSKVSECLTPTPVVIGAGDTLRLSSYETGQGVAALEPGMSTTGGEVRLVHPGSSQASDLVQDMVGYGNAKGFEGAGAATAPKAGRSIVRGQDDKGNFVDTDQNQADFTLSPDEDAPAPPPAGSTDDGDTPPPTGDSP